MKASRFIALILVMLTIVAIVPPVYLPRPEAELLMVVWGMPFEDVLFVDGYAETFEDRHPGVRVRMQRHPNVIDKYKAWHLQGRGADVMRVGIDHYHALVRLGVIEPLDRYISDPDIGLSVEELAQYPQAIWEQLIVDGAVYAIPSDNAQYGLYYNRSLIDAHNAANPDEPVPYPHADWTWQDLRRAADTLTVRDARGRIVQYGVAFDLWAWPFFTFLKQAGGEMWDDEQTTTLINSDAGVEAIRFIVDLLPPDAPVRSLQHADAGATPAELFKVGRVALMFDGSWRAPNLEQDVPDLDFAIAPLPRHRHRAVVSGSVLWAISVHSRHKEQAWEMIKWMTGFEGSLMYWRTLRVAPPANLGVIESEQFLETPGFRDPVTGDRRAAMPRERFADRAEWLRYAVSSDPQTGRTPAFVPAAPYQDDLQQAVTRALVEAVRGEKTPKQALDDAVREVHDVIDRDRRARGLPAVVR